MLPNVNNISIDKLLNCLLSKVTIARQFEELMVMGQKFAQAILGCAVVSQI